MSHQSAVGKAGKTRVGDQPHTFMQALSHQSIIGKHQFLHAGGAFYALVADHQHVAGNDLSGLDRRKGLAVIVKASGAAAEAAHLLRYAGGTDDGAAGGQISLQNF